MPHVLIGPGSIDRRPDAFSSDYLFAHSFGPVQISDFSQGLYVRIWRARVDNATGTVYLCRNNATNDAWEAEIVLFNFIGAPILEMDAAFDQQGHVFVCAERATGVAGASQVWAYYFNGLVGDYAFEMKGAGRTPKALLDDTFDTTNADVLLFYMNDPVGMCYRYQRDRFNTEYTVVLAASLTPVDPNGGDQEAPVGPLKWEAAPDVYINDIDQLWFPIFNTIYSPTVPGHSIIATAKGMYRPLPATLIGGRPSMLYGYQQQPGPETTFNIYFDPPVTGVQVTAVGSNFDNAILRAYAVADDYAHPIGEVLFPKTDGLDPEVRRGFFAPVIAMITLQPSATDRTRWKDFTVRLDAPAAAIPIPAGMPFPAPKCYIEDLYKATDGRVHILYSLRDTVKGQYNLYHYETLLYPITNQDPASLEPSAYIDSGTLRVVLIQQTTDPEGLMATAFIAPGGDLHEVVIERTLYDVEGLMPSAFIAAGGTLISTLPITHTLYDVEGLMGTAFIAPGGTLYVAVISHTLYDKEGLMPTAFIAAGGTLV